MATTSSVVRAAQERQVPGHDAAKIRQDPIFRHAAGCSDCAGAVEGGLIELGIVESKVPKEALPLAGG